jgi:hypothetical protein
VHWNGVVEDSVQRANDRPKRCDHSHCRRGERSHTGCDRSQLQKLAPAELNRELEKKIKLKKLKIKKNKNKNKQK